jgi:hypothetical protein
MTKFLISSYPATDENKPVLYEVWFAGKSFMHKGKLLKESVDKFLDAVFRGMKKVKLGQELDTYLLPYKEIIEYCNKYPAINTVHISIILNADAPKLLKKEKSLLKKRIKDENCLDTTDRYTPEWMLKEQRQQRCIEHATVGIIDGKKESFMFCPRCGALIK